MYTVKLITEKGEVIFKTENRPLARAMALLAKENGLTCEVTVETAPRQVKFKGID